MILRALKISFEFIKNFIQSSQDCDLTSACTRALLIVHKFANIKFFIKNFSVQWQTKKNWLPIDENRSLKEQTIGLEIQKIKYR